MEDLPIFSLEVGRMADKKLSKNSKKLEIIFESKKIRNKVVPMC